MGFSGAAFGLLWDGPERSNLPLVFDALGYDYELWMSRQLADETGQPCRIWGWDDNLRRRIFWNLRDRGLPVLLFDWDKWPDWRLITAAEHWWSFRGYGGDNGEGYRPIELFEGMKARQTWTINILAKRSTPRPSEAAEHSRGIHTLVDGIWENLGGLAAPEAPLTLADRSTRETIADLILEIEREDEATAALLAG